MSTRKAAILIVLGAVVAAAAAAGAAVVAMTIGGPAAAPPAASPASPGDKRWLAVAPGRVEPRSGEIRIAAPVVGLVDRVLVKASDKVFAGEPLVQLRDEELEARVKAALAQVAVRKRVRNDQSASGKTDDRRKSEDAVADAETSVFEAQAAVDKAVAEWRASGAPNAALAEARAELVRAQEELARRNAQHRRIEAGAPLPSPLEGQLIAARADLSIARAALDKLTIRAPIDGTILQVNVKAGELAMPSAAQPLLLLADLSSLRVRAELDERDVAEVKIGVPASVRAAAFPGREFAGKVAAIAPLVEPARIGTRGPRTDVDAVQILVDLAEPGPLAVGMRADVYFDRELRANR
jgi:HlyD family secretion protein